MGQTIFGGDEINELTKKKKKSGEKFQKIRNGSLKEEGMANGIRYTEDHNSQWLWKYGGQEGCSVSEFHASRFLRSSQTL